jgi:hypothetical protein
LGGGRVNGMDVDVLNMEDDEVVVECAGAWCWSEVDTEVDERNFSLCSADEEVGGCGARGFGEFVYLIFGHEGTSSEREHDRAEDDETASDDDVDIFFAFPPPSS